MNVRYADREEIANNDNFGMYDDNNEGDSFIVCEDDNGEIVGWAQYTNYMVFFIESIMKGAGRAMVNFLLEENDGLVKACDVLPTAKGFYAKLGFVQCANKHDWELEIVEDED